MPIGNPIRRRSWPANSGLRITCSSHASSGAAERREKSTLRSANKTESRPVGMENRHTRPGQELRLGLLRSGRASLVAVLKSANLWYGNYGAELWRVHGRGSGGSLASERCVLDS